jgi:hypothetical protein
MHSLSVTHFVGTSPAVDEIDKRHCTSELGLNLSCCAMLYTLGRTITDKLGPLQSNEATLVDELIGPIKKK